MGRLSIINTKGIIEEYGKEILCSEQFRNAMGWKHHVHTNVAFHSINVAAISVSICEMLGVMHVKTDKDTVVKAALCHDLGIVREFGSKREECSLHPALSADIAECMGLSENAVSAVRTHMWPVVPGRPKTREGWIISIVDKIACMGEILRANPYHFRHLTADQTCVLFIYRKEYA